MAVIVWSLGLVLWQNHAFITSENTRRMNEAVRLLEESGEQTIRASEALLRRIADKVRANGIAWFRGDEGARWLVDSQSLLPTDGSLWLLDTDGNLVATSTGHPAPANNFAEREYFPLHRDEGVPFHIGRLAKGRTVEDHFAFTLSRRIPDLDGEFGGVVVVAIDIAEFAALSLSYDLPSDAAAGIFRLDGATVFRQPMADAYLDVKLPDDGLALLMATPRGEYETRSAFDGVDRRMSYRVFDSLPLVAFAGIPHHRIWERWLHEALAPSLLAVVALATVGAFGWLAMVSVAREHAVIGRLRQLVGELRRARQAADTANAEKSRFLAAISHDIRQPAQSLMLLTATLRSGLDGPRTPKTLDMMDLSLDSLRLITDELLDLSRLDSGTVVASPQAVALGDLMRRLHDEYQLRASERGLSFHTVPTTCVVRTDPALCERILRNLIENALKYTEAGRVLVGCRRRGGLLTVEVWDTGRGIAPEQLEHIWREFHQIDNPERNLANGLGLGLAIVRRLAAVLGHALSVRSQVGRGSCFRVELPTDPVPQAQKRLVMTAWGDNSPHRKTL